MSVQEIAADLTALCKAGQFQEAIDKHYGEHITSVEFMGENPSVEGLPAINAKTQWWRDNVEVHDMIVDGPFVNANTNTFAVEFTMDCTIKPTGQRMKTREVAVYTVKDDKIVHEQFIGFAG